MRRGLAERGCEVPVVLVNEAGVSAWAAGEEARAEMPDLDPGVRGAVSIARRLQDPLAEIVKIPPRTVGAGQYHSDVPPHRLEKRLDEVVESCVHEVGVDLNTAPVAQMSRIAGIGPVLAEAIAEFRARSGPFRSRRQLVEAARLEPRGFEQVAGFVRVVGGESSFDASRIHPERRPALEAFATAAGLSLDELLSGGAASAARMRGDDGAELRREIGEHAVAEIAAEIEHPPSDPRGTWEPVAFRADVASIEDLKPGMVCPGVVTNVTAFGAFVDVGAKQDGLVHVSRLSDRFVGDPAEVVSPGDRVQVRVVEVDVEKRQVSLTMRAPEREARRGGAGSPGAAEREGRRGERRGGRGDGRPRGPRREGGGEHRGRDARGGDGARDARAATPGEARGGRDERPRRGRDGDRRDGRGDARPGGPEVPSTPRGMRADERRDRDRP
ncbi:MAG: helix-hairpin-helix domain-containing protein, partial [Alphaproteobacteria bacterium]